MTNDMSEFAQVVLANKYLKDGEKTWEDVANRVAQAVVGPVFPDLVPEVAEAIANREFLPGGRFLANAGGSMFTNNCFLYRCEDSKEGIADVFRKVTITGMTGGGVGVVWSDLRPRGASVKSNGGESTGPCAFMQAVNEIGRGVVNGGSRRMAIWAGLHWWHPDVFEFMQMKNWDEHVSAAKAEDFSAYAPMDMTNITVILDDEFFAAFEDESFSTTIRWGDDVYTIDHAWARRVYETAVEQMLETGEPGFSVDTGENAGENLRNPCGEITSADDSDVCCLGSVNIAAIEDLQRLSEVVRLGTAFLVAGTVTANLPHAEVYATRDKNRRLGLGLMGIHEWLVARGLPYEPCDELGDWLDVWRGESDWAAGFYAHRAGVSKPVKVRAIAPTGTIGIIAETTTGIEPLFAAAYKRRYLDAGEWKFQYVVDATARRLVEKYGIDPKDLECAYDLAQDPDRRLAMQAFVQSYTDHAISSTLNLPRFEQQAFSPAEFGEILMRHLPNLRGVTAYPDGARSGQPLEVADYATAVASEGVEFAEAGLEQACVNGVCGI